MKRLFFILLIFTLFQGQFPVFAQTPPTEAEPAKIDPEKDLIHPGDTIDVDVLGSFEYDWRGTLTPEGFLNGLDFIEEPVFAQCKSEPEVAEAVARGYSKLLKEPKVVVRIVDRSKRPSTVIYGAVQKQQRFQIKRPVLLNELIILSGGLTDLSSGVIQIFRPQNLSCAAIFEAENKKSVETADRERFVSASQENGTVYLNIRVSDLLKGERDSNPQIYGGDIITVLEAEPIYIIGGVIAPKRISSRSEMTVSRAIASAGGFSKDSNSENITIFRREGNETKIIQINYKELKSNKEKDIVLQPFDVVDVAVKGRGKSKFAPVIRDGAENNKSQTVLPLTVID